MVTQETTVQPTLPVIDRTAAAEIRSRQDLDWFHRIEVDGYVTPGFAYEFNWRFVAAFLQRHASIIAGAEILEPGCADGLWTCWLTKLGARHIAASDLETREQFRLVMRAFGLPATYYPGVISVRLPKSIKRSFDVVVSLGVLYHVHDPWTTLVMYGRYLRHGGVLLLETGAIEADEPYIHYTGTGEIYGKEGGNQFIPTIGFLRTALPELGLTIEDLDFRVDPYLDGLGRRVGRTILAARKTGSVGIAHYPTLLAQLDMLGPEFPRERWYEERF